MTSPSDNPVGPFDVSDRKVVIFSGHMIDHPVRETPRFPPARVGEVTRKLLESMDKLGLGSGDIGISGGACGGDLLFAESALALGMQMEIFLHAREARFIEDSVRFAGQKWLELFQQVVQHPRSRVHILPSDRDRKDGISNVFVANNHWMRETAMQLGRDRLHGIILWDGKTGDGPGGTAEMQRYFHEHGIACHLIAL